MPYKYFAKNFGTTDKKQFEDELNEKQNDYGKQQLKHELLNKDIVSICFISKLLHSKIDTKNKKIFISDHDTEIKKLGIR